MFVKITSLKKWEEEHDLPVVARALHVNCSMLVQKNPQSKVGARADQLDYEPKNKPEKLANFLFCYSSTFTIRVRENLFINQVLFSYVACCNSKMILEW